MSALDVPDAMRPCTACDLFKVGEGTPAKVLADINEYLAPFAAPLKVDGGIVCNNCKKPLDSFKQMFGVGVAIEWGLAHGEGSCSGCGWPYRGMHYAKDSDGTELFTLRNLFLAYLPKHVEQRSAEEAA